MDEFINKHQNTITGMVIALVLAYGAYHFFFQPQLKENKNLKTSLSLIDSEIKMIPGGDLILKDLEGAKSLLAKELSDISKKIPSETETPYLISNYISTVGKGLNIDYNLIQPSELVPEGKYKRLPLRLEFEGNYANFNGYLSQLKNLPVTIRVDNLDLNKLMATKKLSIKMQLSVFVMPGGAEKAPGGEKGYPYSFDPFYRELAKKEGLQLEGIQSLKYSGYFIGRGIKAIINDELVGTGGSIQGFNVYKIYKDRVILKKGGKLYELPLKGK